MIPKAEALELIEGLERASRRTRPFLWFGLAAILAGFLSLSIYLYTDRQEEKRRANELAGEVASLQHTLRQARSLAARPHSDHWAHDELRRVLGVAIGQAAALETTIDEAQAAADQSRPTVEPPRAPPAESAPPRQATPPPKAAEEASPQPAVPPKSDRPNPAAPAADRLRLIIRVASPEQMEEARAMAERIGGQLPYLGRMRGTDISVVEGSEAGDHKLRCFRSADCRLSYPVVAYINTKLRELGMRPIGRTSGMRAPEAATIEPGTYEIRLAPGSLADPRRSPPRPEEAAANSAR